MTRLGWLLVAPSSLHALEEGVCYESAIQEVLLGCGLLAFLLFSLTEQLLALKETLRCAVEALLLHGLSLLCGARVCDLRVQPLLPLSLALAQLVLLRGDVEIRVACLRFFPLAELAHDVFLVRVRCC